MITIPATVLDLLGGPRAVDPPVLFDGGVLQSNSDPEPYRLVGAAHPSVTEGYASVSSRKLLLPQSAPALLAVLARAVGLDVKPWMVPTWSKDARLRIPHPGGMWPGGSPPMDYCERRFVADLTSGETRLRDRRGMENLWVIVPTLAGITDPMEALAEVCCYLARLKRLSEHLAPGYDLNADPTPKQLAEQEAHLDLPPLARLDPTPGGESPQPEEPCRRGLGTRKRSRDGV